MNQPPAWVARYVGLPFAEHGRGPGAFDCWGLVRWVQLLEFGIELPMHEGYARCTHRPSVAQAFHAGLAQGWAVVPPEQASPGNIVIFNEAMREAGSIVWRPCHVGLIVARHTMLHVQRHIDSVVERFDRQPWAGRIEGVYRHVSSA